MTTSKKHLFKKPNVDMQSWPLDPSMGSTINAETMVWYDRNSKYVKELSNDTNATYFVGLLIDQVPVTVYGSDYQHGGGSINPNMPSNDLGMVVRYGQAVFKATSGENYTAGASLYAGADGQTVTTSSGSHPIGFVSGEQADITSATAGEPVLVDFRATWPATPVN